MKKIKIDKEFKWQDLGNFNLPCTLKLTNRGEIKLNLTLGLPAAVCSKKVQFYFPQLLDFVVIVFFRKHYCNGLSELLDIERQTTGQNCSVRQNHRKIRLIASDVKQIVARKSDFPALASNIYENKNKDLSAIQAVAFDIKNENYCQLAVSNLDKCILIMYHNEKCNTVEKFFLETITFIQNFGKIAVKN
ncbi:hypothetical protein TNCT_621301 [Trichonephila clavata]|uniref:Uncharacterized protein n=1 Tax=Trichonephila clavata TaxID=2740835 RepID=A0A8X6K5C2_TRICU|nr:hypothetical protein TNCT_621301 [Trichonephila clavata]